MMSRAFAFLRAINVGGHVVKMDHLRQVFEELGFSKVETFIASGNVVFETDCQDLLDLERQIEARLEAEFGYDVAAFIRTGEELTAIARYQPFPPSEIRLATALNVAFLKNTLDEASQQKLIALRSDIDEFHVHLKEVYWLCQKKQSESTFSNAVLEKTLGVKSTLRGVNTIKKIVEKYG